MRAWHAFHRLHAAIRWPLKFLAFIVVVALVLYPKPWLLTVWYQRITNMNSVLDPQHPALAALETEVRQKLPLDAPPQDVLAAVQKTVYQHVPYAWDWDVWGVVEYLPTVAEVFEKGREDCDGRAVVAASLLRRMGYEANLVSDILHVWVQTPQGETMSPTSKNKVLVATETGTQTRITPELIQNLGRGLSYGIAAFPLLRETIILAALAFITMHPRSNPWRRVAGVLLLWIALDLMREQDLTAVVKDERIWKTWAGVAIALGGWLTLAAKSRRRPVAVE